MRKNAEKPRALGENRAGRRAGGQRTGSRRILALLLAGVLSAGALTGCGGNGGKTPADPTTPAQATPAAEPTTPVEPTPTPEPTATPEPTPTTEPTAVPEIQYEIPDIPPESFEIPENDSLAFVRDMKIGWNLGNSFDAIDCNVKDELAYESAWCGAKASLRLIQAIKEAGFQTIRIPVSWHNHVTGDDYRISEPWIARVQEVVDMALDEGMYVILNIHHDNSTEFMYPTTEYLEQSTHYVTCVWEQIAARFADYDDHLIFETLNEPRMVGTNFEWWLNGNDDSCKDSVAALNELNQVIVNTIRASEGNNAQRYIMVPGYCASPDGVLNSGFVLPEDSAENKLIVSVHAYSPYDFALNENGTAEFDWKKKSDLVGFTSFMDNLYKKFIKNGIPIVIGEFGARAKSNTQARIDFSTAYVAAARARGITCCWWDNNAFVGKGELFGLIDRKALKWRFGEIVPALMKYAE
ncbi:MAG: glycoside hydrolase family 5 protein [Lachnospiraceae bacterium]|nr:glycoside hydrolase family 5 protein [Lachnospiraceae bacterium]